MSSADKISRGEEETGDRSQRATAPDNRGGCRSQKLLEFLESDHPGAKARSQKLLESDHPGAKARRAGRE